MDQFKVIRAWEGGPLMEFSGDPHPKGRWQPYHTFENDPLLQFSRNYVCDECRSTVSGLYEPKQGVGDSRKWLCGDCRNRLRPKQEQPAHLRNG